MNFSSSYFENHECAFYPCHEGLNEINCLFCYCPLYHMDPCPGKPSFIEKDGHRIKACTDCVFPHLEENYETINELLRK